MGDGEERGREVRDERPWRQGGREREEEEKKGEERAMSGLSGPAVSSQVLQLDANRARVKGGREGGREGEGRERGERERGGESPRPWSVP